MAENKGVLPSSNVNTLGNANNKWENVYANKFTGALTGNASTASSAAKLTTARSINGTNFNGTGNITTANWGTARNISIADATATNTGTGVSVNGSGNVTLKLPATIKASITGGCSGNSATSTKLNSRGSQTAITAKEEAGLYMHTVYQNGYPCSYGNVITTGGDGGGQLLLGWSGADKGIEHLYYRNRRDAITLWSDWKTVAFTTDNVASATKLQTARTINGTSFNGSANITTANWGTARNISIADATATNTGTGVSVNGSGNATLKLPATIKANITGNCSGSSGSCTGNSATATKATQDSAGQQINSTYIKGLSVSGATLTITKGNGSTSTATINQTAGMLPATRVLQGGGTKLYSYNGGLDDGDITLSQAFTNFKYLVIFLSQDGKSEDLHVATIETAALYQAMAGNNTYWPGNNGASVANRVLLSRGPHWWAIFNIRGGSSTTYFRHATNEGARVFSIYGIN